MSDLASHASTIHSLYLAFYGRPADPAGLHYWSDILAANPGSMNAIATAFVTSDEARTRFGSDTPAERVAEIYQSLFSRAPDAAGLAYWTGLIEHGDVSFGAVSLAILQGAQGRDDTLAGLRREAVEAFTAAVEAADSGYQGGAALKAAQVLVRAVTIDSARSDLDALVAAAVSFADTATLTPQVVDALAAGASLQALYDTARGAADPLALTRALADIAKAAAGDPVTLDQLLRGGGMLQVLKAMPARATLQDVVDALAEGGLPAAVEVVYPDPPVSQPPQPPQPALALAFKSVSQGEYDRNPLDNVTNVAQADVVFGYSGKDLADGQSIEFSIGGGAWQDSGYGIDTQARTITLQGVDLGTHDGTTGIALRVLGADGQPVASASTDIVVDTHVDTPGLVFDSGVPNARLLWQGVPYTNSAAFSAGNIEQGALVEYRIPDEEWSGVAPTLETGTNRFSVRQTDAAGNRAEADFTLVLDEDAPARPILVLADDTGSDDGDGITSVGRFAISGLDEGGDTGWEYSLDGGAHWIFGAANDGSGVAELNLPTPGSLSLQVRQLDAAGNVSVATDALAVTVDTAAPDNALAFIGIEGGQGGNTTGDPSADLQFRIDGGLPADALVEWRYQDVGGAWTALEQDTLAADGADTIATVRDFDLSTADRTIEIRLNDVAGNHGATVTQAIDGPASANPLRVTAAPDGVHIESTHAGQLQLAEHGMTWVRTTAPDGQAVVGHNLVVDQVAPVRGFFMMMMGGVQDAEQTVVGLGSAGDDVMSATPYAWGFGGADELVDTIGDDYLVGGKDGDIIHLGEGGDDSVVIGAGDTARDLVFEDGGASYFEMDIVEYAGAGDRIVLGDVFTAAPELQSTLLEDATVNQVALVRGVLDMGQFVVDASAVATSWLLQWSDGEHVNSIVLRDYGDVAPDFAIDVATGSMTLVELVGSPAG